MSKNIFRLMAVAATALCMTQTANAGLLTCNSLGIGIVTSTGKVFGKIRVTNLSTKKSINVKSEGNPRVYRVTTDLTLQLEPMAFTSEGTGVMPIKVQKGDGEITEHLCNYVGRGPVITF